MASTTPRSYGTPFTTPFRWQDPPRRVPHFKDIWPYPCLPAIRKMGYGAGDNRWDDAVVIDQGEPVGIYVDSNGRRWLVPCVGTTAVTITYGSYDVEQGIENIDSLGSAIGSAGVSSATIPAVLPLGIAKDPIVRSFSYTTGIPAFSDFAQNYKPEYKPTIAKDGIIEIPFYRFGPKAIGDADAGDSIMPGNINGGTISASNRPFLKVANMSSITGATVSNQATVVITVAVGNALEDGRQFTLVTQGNTYTFTVLTSGTPVAADGEFLVGAANTDTATSLKAAIDAVIPTAVATTGIASNAVTVTAAVYGSEGNFTYTELTAISDLSASASNATQDVSRLEVTSVPAIKNLNMIMGKVLLAAKDLYEIGDSVPSLYYMKTTPGLALAGSATGGVPAEFYVAGNSPKGNVLPVDYTEAGFVRILIY